MNNFKLAVRSLPVLGHLNFDQWLALCLEKNFAKEVFRVKYKLLSFPRYMQECFDHVQVYSKVLRDAQFECLSLLVRFF